MWELRHKQLVAELIESLHRQGIRSVILKGTAYAYGLYDDPSHRIRGDTDILIRPLDRAHASAIFASLGWRRSGPMHGRFAGPPWQEVWQYRDAAGFTHDIDLHWMTISAMALGHILPLDHVMRSAVALPALSANALALDLPGSFLCSIVNRSIHARIGHYSLDRNEYDPDRLLWAKDFDLIANAMSPGEWDSLAERAEGAGIASLCMQAFTFAQTRLGTIIPQGVEERLASQPADTPAVRFINGYGPTRRFLADLAAAPGPLAKGEYILARAIPSAEYLRDKYPDQARWPVWALHLRRHANGLAQAVGWSRAP